jgi:antitoxin ParD1/3/4
MSGKTRMVELTPELDADIRRRMQSGAYASEVEVIRAGLRALDRDDGDRAQRLAQLDASIARGIADADAGRVYAAEDVFDELRAKLVVNADMPRR